MSMIIPTEIYVKYEGSEELIKIQDLDVTRYTMFLAGMSTLTGIYLEKKLQKDAEDALTGPLGFLKAMRNKIGGDT